MKIEHLLMAKALDALQSPENEGRGIQCVREVVAYLMLGDLNSARRVAGSDWDKIRNYPKIVEWMKNCLFDSL